MMGGLFLCWQAVYVFSLGYGNRRRRAPLSASIPASCQIQSRPPAKLIEDIFCIQSKSTDLDKKYPYMPPVTARSYALVCPHLLHAILMKFARIPEHTTLGIKLSPGSISVDCEPVWSFPYPIKDNWPSQEISVHASGDDPPLTPSRLSASPTCKFDGNRARPRAYHIGDRVFAYKIEFVRISTINITIVGVANNHYWFGDKLTRPFYDALTRALGLSIWLRMHTSVEHTDCQLTLYE